MKCTGPYLQKLCKNDWLGVEAITPAEFLRRKQARRAALEEVSLNALSRAPKGTLWEQRQKMMFELLRQAGGHMAPGEIARKLKCCISTVTNMARTLKSDGRLRVISRQGKFEHALPEKDGWKVEVELAGAGGGWTDISGDVATGRCSSCGCPIPEEGKCDLCADGPPLSLHSGSG